MPPVIGLIGRILWCFVLFLSFAIPCKADERASLINEQLQEILQSTKLPQKIIHANDDDRPQWQREWQQVRGIARNGDLSSASQGYESLLLKYSGLQHARWELAGIHIRLRDFAKAITHLELLVEENPQTVSYLSGLAYTLFESNQLDRVAKLFEKILEIQPENGTALRGMVYVCLQLEQREKALKYQEKLFKLVPSNSFVLLRLAKLYESFGQDEKALPHLVVLSQNPQAEVSILEMTALAHDRLNLENLAVEYWQRVLEKKPTHRLARLKLSQAEGEAGRRNKALDYLLPALNLDKADTEILWEVANLYIKEEKYVEALPYLEQCVALKAFSKQVLNGLVEVHSALGNRQEIITVLETYFSLDQDPSQLELKHAARLFSATGRFREAVPFYTRLLAIAPDDPDTLSTLAKDLINVAQNDGKFGMRRYFRRLGPKRVELYRSMADLLKKLGRQEEYLEVLETIHDLQPSDTEITLELAQIFYEKGDLTRSLYFYERLELVGYKSVEFHEGRGILFTKSMKFKQALLDLKEVLHLAPERHQVRLQLIDIAGQLGLLEEVRRHFNKLKSYASTALKYDGIFRIANAFRNCGAFDDAQKLYFSLLAANESDNIVLGQTYLEISKTYHQAGLVFEAEENFRKALLYAPEGLDEIFWLLGKSSVKNDTLIDHTQWLFRWFSLKQKKNDLEAKENDEDRQRFNWNIKRLRARLLAVDGKYDEATYLAWDIFTEVGAQATDDMTLKSQLRRSIGMDLAGYYLENNQPSKAARICQILLEEGRASEKTEFHPLFMLLKSYQRQKKSSEARDVFARILFAARQDVGRLLIAAQLAKKYGIPEQMLFLSRTALDELPQSLKAKFLLADALEDQGGKQEAIGIIARLVAEYPDNNKAVTAYIRLLLKNGEFLEALTRCDAILALDPNRIDIILYKVRALWALQRFPEAIEVYQGIITHSADSLFADELENNHLQIDVPDQEPTLWQRITFSQESPPTLLELALSHVGLPDNHVERKKIVKMAVAYYALHNWQKRFAKELAARDAVKRRSFYSAIYQYEDLIEEYQVEESLLFDLAGIYSRLDMLLDEALLYEKIMSLDASFPGLQNARQRNWLKRRPRGSMGGTYLREEGYFGYKSMEREEVQAAFWVSPKPQHELDIVVKRIGYSSMDISSRVASRRLYLSYRSHFMNGFSLTMGAGVEDLEDGYPSSGLFDCKISSKLGDRLTGDLSVKRDVVADTTASLMRNIIETDISSGLSLGLLPHLKVGGDYGVRYLSDNNYTLHYQFWTTYQFFQEPYFLNFKYAYDFKESKNGAQAGLPLEDGFAENDHPYWAPKNYWRNRFELYFKHQLSEDSLRRGVPRYYTLKYTLDYDAQGYGAQTLAGSFFLEWTPHFIMEASGLYKSSQISRIKEVNINAVYRW